MSLVPALILSAVVTVGLVARSRGPRLAIEPFPSALRQAMAVLLLTAVLALTALLPLQGLYGEPVVPDPEEIGFAPLFLSHAVLAGFLVAWWGLAGFEAPARFLSLPLGMGDVSRRALVGVAAGLAIWGTTIGAMALAAALLGFGGGAGGIEATSDLEEIPDVVRMIVILPLWLRLALVVSAGVFEEAFFRSFLQVRGGLVLSTVVFTMSHASYGLPFMLIGVFTVSILLGLLFRSRRDVLPCMVAHAVFDAVQLFVVLPALVEASA